MANWSVGTSDQFYSQIALPPELRLLNGLSNGVVTTESATGFSFHGILRTETTGTLFGRENGIKLEYGSDFKVWLLHSNSGASGNWSTFGTKSNIISQGTPIEVHVDLVYGVSGSYTVNGQSIPYPALSKPLNPLSRLFGIGSVMSIGGYISPKMSFGTFELNGYSYIQQGDQSATTLVPSHPSGANGTLVGGASWQYTGIVGNYLTVALAVSAITATNPTEPVTIYILDRSTDVSGIPATINGQPVTLDYTYCVTCDASFGFSFGFNF